MKVTSNCLECTKEHIWYQYPHLPDKKYCSMECRATHQKKHTILTKTLIKTCVYCSKDFTCRNSKRILCSKKCMYEHRKESNLVYLNCANCKIKFFVRRCASYGRRFCSQICMATSESKRDSSRTQMLENNPMTNNKSIKKIATTKLKKYGNPKYNNPEKNKETMIAKYGVAYGFQTKKSNGIGVSKIQKAYYKFIKNKFPDAILEHYLPDINIAVDIFIPSKNKVIEVYGDYWHCNPKKFASDYYHSQLHLTAKQKWAVDNDRMDIMNTAGYLTEIVWEADIRKILK